MHRFFSGTRKFDRAELAVPPTLDLYKLCAKSNNNNNNVTYELVGGVLYDDGDYVAVLKDPSVVVSELDDDE